MSTRGSAWRCVASKSSAHAAALREVGKRSGARRRDLLANHHFVGGDDDIETVLRHILVDQALPLILVTMEVKHL